MKLVKLITIIVTLAFFVNFCAGEKKVQKVQEVQKIQEVQKVQEVRKESAVSIGDILKKASCPLSKEQEKKLKEFKPSGDMEAFRAVYEIFDGKQTEALKAVFGSSPGRDGGPERPRFLFFAIIFENENCPLAEEQLSRIKTLPSGREAFQQMQEILTEKQNEILQGMFNR